MSSEPTFESTMQQQVEASMAALSTGPAASSPALTADPTAAAVPPLERSSSVERCSADLYLTSLSPSVIPSAVGAIIHLLLFASTPFYSYTHTDEELSLLLDADTLRAFPSGWLTVGPGVYRAIEINAGIETIDVAGIVSSLCEPLFQQPNPIEDMLYLSTFLSEVVLVRPDDVDSTTDALGSNLTFLLESRRKLKEAKSAAAATAAADADGHVEEEKAEDEDKVAPLATGAIDARPPECADEVVAHLSKLPFSLALLTFHEQHLPQCSYAILSALMRSQPPASSSSSAAAAAAAALRPNFFSLTKAGTQISLIVESSCVTLFPSEVVTQHKSVWSAIQISQGAETSEEGLVAPISSILGQAGVSLYYLSTFNLDYILVSAEEVERALATLQQRMNILVEEY